MAYDSSNLNGLKCDICFSFISLLLKHLPVGLV